MTYLINVVLPSSSAYMLYTFTKGCFCSLAGKYRGEVHIVFFNGFPPKSLK